MFRSALRHEGIWEVLRNVLHDCQLLHPDRYPDRRRSDQSLRWGLLGSHSVYWALLCRRLCVIRSCEGPEVWLGLEDCLVSRQKGMVQLTGDGLSFEENVLLHKRIELY